METLLDCIPARSGVAHLYIVTSVLCDTILGPKLPCSTILHSKTGATHTILTSNALADTPIDKEMIDPLAALGMASNIVQFVDLAAKVLAESKALYKSASGASAGNIFIGTITEDIRKLSDKSISQATAGTIPEELLVFTSQCKDSASDLLVVLNKTRVKKPGGLLRSIFQAIKNLRYSAKISELAGCVESLRNQILYRLQVMMSDKQASFLPAIYSLVEESSKWQGDRAEELQNHLKNIEQVINATKTDMNILHQTLVQLIHSIDALAFENPILQSLVFDDIERRHDNITKAAEETFQWIFRPESDFLEWLEQGKGIYWIAGKAGSGKSTFVKYIESHEMTIDALNIWAGDCTLVRSSYYFWNSGTELQKSHEGLLQTILFQILHHCPELIRYVLPAIPSLRLEDLTREDISNYVKQEFESDRQLSALIEQHPGHYLGFVCDLVHKANGVFLWAYLTVKSLQRGMRDRDSIATLHKRLRTTPPDLDRLFGQLLDSVEPINKKRMAHVLQIALFKQEPINLILYWIMDEFLVEWDPSQRIKPLNLTGIEQAREDIEKRINAQTVGLLEVHEYPTYGTMALDTKRVEFFHRSARDYVMTSSVQDQRSGYSRRGESPTSYLARAYLILIKIWPGGPDGLQPMDLQECQDFLNLFVRNVKLWMKEGTQEPSEVLDKTWIFLMSLSWPVYHEDWLREVILTTHSITAWINSSSIR